MDNSNKFHSQKFCLKNLDRPLLNIVQKPMSAPSRLCQVACSHTTDSSCAIARLHQSCTPAAKTGAPSSSFRPISHQQHKSKICICLARQSENSRTTNDASTSGRLAPAAASRQQVFTNCSFVSAAFIAVAAAIRLAAPVTGPYLFKSNQPAVQALLQSECIQFVCSKVQQLVLSYVHDISIHRYHAYVNHSKLQTCMRLQSAMATWQIMLWSHWQQQA